MGIRKPDVLASFILALLAGSATWYLIPPSYKAQARLQVATQPPRVLFQTVETQTVNGEEYKRYQSTQQNLVKSNLVLGAALNGSKVRQCLMIREQADPVEWLEQKLNVDFIANSELMEISLTGNDPEQLACIVGAVKQGYMDEVVNVDAKRRMMRQESLRKLKEKYTDLLGTKRDTLRKLAATVGSDNQATMVLRQQHAEARLHDLSTQRFRLQLERSEVETLLTRRKKAETAATEPARKEIAQLEDRLAVVIAGQELIDGRLERLAADKPKPLAIEMPELTQLQDEIAQMEDTSRKIGAELEAVTVELEAAPRIRTIDEASVPRTGDDKQRFMMIGLLTSGAFFVALLGLTLGRLAGVKPAVSAGDASGSATAGAEGLGG